MCKSKTLLQCLFLASFGLAAYPTFAVNTTIVGNLGDLDGDGDGGAGEEAVLEAAAACWDARITTNRDFTLTVNTAPLSGGTLGTGATTAIDANDVPTAGRITIDDANPPTPTLWWVDPTPDDSLEFDPNPDSQWSFLNGPGRDLYSTVLHEIGHAHGWLCGDPCGFNNPSYDAMKDPQPGNFVANPACTSPFPLAGEDPLDGCVHLVSLPDYDVSLRGDGLGGSGSSVVNELSHPGVANDLMLGFSGTGTRQTPSEDNVEMFRQAYDDTVNLPPSLNPEDINAECSLEGGANVTLDAVATDPEDDPLTYAWACGAVALNDPQEANPQGFFPLGTADCRVDVTDLPACSPNAAVLSVTVADTTPPIIDSMMASPNELWPPNHRMVDVAVNVSVSDICDPGASCQILSVSSNEPVNAVGDGNTDPDWEIVGPLAVKLRAERSGTGSGRVYTIAVECADSSGNIAQDTVEVRVPHDRR